MAGLMAGDETAREEGAALPIVLAFITVFGLIVGALLGQASVNFNATTALRDNRDRLLAADAGLEWALARSIDLTSGLALSAPVTCDQTLDVNGAVVTVECAAGSTASELSVTSTAVKGGHTSVATAVIVRTPAGGYVPRAWQTASD